MLTHVFEIFCECVRTFYKKQSWYYFFQFSYQRQVHHVAFELM